jgi:hypothetical protein
LLEVAKDIEKEASKLGIDGAKKSIDDAAVKIEKHVSGKSSGSAYNTAKSGGKYTKEYNNSLKLTNKELEKSIKSHQKVVDEHAAKIANPEKYASDFNQRTQIQKEGLIRHWNNDMERAAAYRDIKEGILIERGALR